MTSIRGVLLRGSERLAAAGVPGAARDARLLLAEALGLPAGRLTLVMDDEVAISAVRSFDAMLEDRANFRPVAQIIGRRAFWGRAFEVTRDVLDPRPETETLVAAALAGGAPRRVLDIGTGSGAILVTLLCEWPEASGVGTDVSAAALAVAARNAARHGVDARTELRETDWMDGVAGKFDLVVSNPPYIPKGDVPRLSRDVREWEPLGALTIGETGLEAYRAIAGRLDAAMAPGGRVLFETGSDQTAAVSEILARAGFSGFSVHKDMDGRSRVVEAMKPR